MYEDTIELPDMTVFSRAALYQFVYKNLALNYKNDTSMSSREIFTTKNKDVVHFYNYLMN